MLRKNFHSKQGQVEIINVTNKGYTFLEGTECMQQKKKKKKKCINHLKSTKSWEGHLFVLFYPIQGTYKRKLLGVSIIDSE